MCWMYRNNKYLLCFLLRTVKKMHKYDIADCWMTADFTLYKPIGVGDGWGAPWCASAPSSSVLQRVGKWLIAPTTCRNYLLIVKAWKQRTKIRMGRLPFSHVRMNYFWWAKTERIVVYSAVNLLFRNNKIQLSKCHHITIFMNCKISLTYISETHWKQSIKFQIESRFHFPFS